MPVRVTSTTCSTALAPQVKHAQNLADHCTQLEAALAHMRSKLPCVREATTQTGNSFLSDVRAERNASAGQRYVDRLVELLLTECIRYQTTGNAK